jgi:chromosome segregation ATPase
MKLGRSSGGTSRAPRTPHPDPVTELKLQRIISMQQQAAARVLLAEDYRQEIKKLHNQARDLREYKPNQARYAEDRANELHKKIRELDGDVTRLYDEISEAMSAVDPSDLAFINPVK